MADRPWPAALRWSAAQFQIVSASRSGGPSFQGQEQIVAAPTGRWKASLTIPVADKGYGPQVRRDAVLAYRGMVSGGRASIILVPAHDGRGPAHRIGIVPRGYAVPHSDEAGFSDGVGYGQSFTNAILPTGAALNATEIQIAVPAGLSLLPGMRFSTPDGRLHEISDIAAFDGNGVWSVTVAPWLRAAYPAGTAIDFDRPVCRMRLASDETGALSLSLNRFGTSTVDFVEAF